MRPCRDGLEAVKSRRDQDRTSFVFDRTSVHCSSELQTPHQVVFDIGYVDVCWHDRYLPEDRNKN